MTERNLDLVQALVEACDSLPGLREALKASESPEQAALVAKDHGFEVTAEDLLVYQAGLLTQTLELDDDALQAVTGGTENPDFKVSSETVTTPYPRGFQFI